jgi:hypothetical protein
LPVQEEAGWRRSTAMKFSTTVEAFSHPLMEETQANQELANQLHVPYCVG